MSTRRKVLGGAVAVVVGGGGAAGAAWLTNAAQPQSGGSAAAQVPTGTAEVANGTVAERFQASAKFGYGSEYAIVHLGEPGVLTALTAPEIVVARGAQLYAVANQTVRLLYGNVPAYRAFETGMPDGPDVRQLEKNLLALGHDPGHRLTVDGHFSAATATAIRRWQAAWGLPAAQRSGSLPLGQVVFQPAAVRIKEANIAVGVLAQPDQPVLTVTPTKPVVTAQVNADRRRLIHVGDPVFITMTATAPFPGTVLAITRPAAATQPDSPGGGSAESMYQVTISATPPAGSGDLDQASVSAAFTRQTHQNVLTVPITALLARPGGGYQVRLASDQYVPVEPGLFDSTTGRVEVTGQLTAGQRVKVPAS